MPAASSSTEDEAWQRMCIVIETLKKEVGNSFSSEFLEKLITLLGISDSDRTRIITAVPRLGHGQIGVDDFASWCFSTKRPKDVFAAIFAGGYGTSAITKNKGLVKLWGDLPREASGQVAADTSCEVLAIGFSHVAALTSAGRLVCWGDDSYGECTKAPSLASSEKVTQLTAGKHHTAALTSDGKLYCWGDDRCGQCQVPNESEKFVQVAAGGYHTAAITSSGGIVAWGEDTFGQCSRIPSLQSGDKFIHVKCGRHHTVATSSDGGFFGWGDDSYGQCSRVPPLEASEKIMQVSAGAYHTVALTSDFRVVAWGSDIQGQCSQAPSGKFSAVAAGDFHTVALDAGGVAHCWGHNDHDQCSEGRSRISISAIGGCGEASTAVPA
mmetsp:Transcript_103145/g.290169  ORF Transcript_103145/g.290169 Transcript_103145/m.290169 type:complete len:382 (-) Transcript_103145:130-1275(-)